MRRVLRTRVLQGTAAGPQITIGLLIESVGFPLMIEVFEGHKADTKTMQPTITSFMAAQLADVTVVADAGMVP